MPAESTERPNRSVAVAGAGDVAQFYIPAAASLQERRPRTLKHGDTFALFDHNGDAIGAPGSPEGLFHFDTRHLSFLRLTLEGQRPMLLSSTLRDDNAALTCDLTNPDLFDQEGALWLEHDLIHLRRSRFLWNGACYERLSVRNFDDRPRRVCIDIAFDADFADLFEVRGTQRLRRGTMHPPQVDGAAVTLSYTGLDEARRETRISFDPQPQALSGSRASFTLLLKPSCMQLLRMEIRCKSVDHEEREAQSFLGALLQSRRELRRSSGRAASITTSNELFNEVARRSISDLYMLLTNTVHGPYPYAGIPWFSTVFGRDALITALQTLWLDPEIARGVLQYLAAMQAETVDPGADAEPGKILHEMRHGEMARLGEVPFALYYGSVDATPLFVLLAGAYLRRTGDVDTVRALWPRLQAALDWISEYGDRDGDLFVEYGRQSPEGLINQGWKDSRDSVFHEDGRLAAGPIALAEVQAYTYGAWQAAAQIRAALDDSEGAARYAARAEVLRDAFDKHFYDPALGTYVLALDGSKQPCRIRASNAGHTLFTGIALQERAPSVVGTLMQSTSFCGWGIRTVAADAARFNPMSYHNGSVWPHDNALIAAGMARYGYHPEASRIFEGLFAASSYIDLRRLPELFCGFARQRSQGPTFYPVACAPQAWAAAAPLLMLQACLGLDFDTQEPAITFENPSLPPFLDEVVFRNLGVGGGSADVAVRRSGERVVVDVLERRGPVRVLTRN
ncbi:putative Amylo-alpha-1,6-glucosidase (plasmid) [Cupriavidus taiwanensis]|uniref:Putative Amylo-alpha-1,6-glucosidase n=1 Tax=Cupriavidus taiwanensis TaxID=164546 RepID=A0A375IS41_9BURK|nr:amylo-alpha-1,6-glucosidase [Cupriavidus taiwanensis]SPK76968.1 putative Amylo-alpha-1,6-glucosidase [Cupriavidus taiwanensis]